MTPFFLSVSSSSNLTIRRCECYCKIHLSKLSKMLLDCIEQVYRLVCLLMDHKENQSPAQQRRQIQIAELIRNTWGFGKVGYTAHSLQDIGFPGAAS